MDAGSAAGVTLTPVTPTLGDRRGPVLLHFTVTDPNHEVTAFRLEQAQDLNFVPATTMSISQNGNDVIAAWNSFADVQADTMTTVRLVGTTASGDVDAPLQVSLKNDPETDRLILVGHELMDAPDGSATETGTDVSAVTWSSRMKQVIGSQVDVTVGQGPQDLRAAPHGRATAVVEATSGNVTLLATPLSASAAGVTFIATLKVPQGSAADAHWSPDGRYLYVAGQGPDAIWRFEPSEDLSSVASPTMLIALPGPPSRFDVDRTTGMLLVACGDGMDYKTKLVLYQPDGTEATRLVEDLDPANGLTIAPFGGLALWTGNLSGDQVRAFQFTSSSITEPVMPLTSVGSPTEVVFHPGSTAASGAVLISDLDHNKVTSLTYSGTTLAVDSTASASLAASMDLIERGSLAGNVFVPTVSYTDPGVSSIARIELSLDGTVHSDGSVHDFGTTTKDLPSGISVQR